MRLSLNRLKKLSPSEVSTYSRKEIMDMLKQARKMYDNRVKTFEKNPSVYSPALEKMEFYYEEGREGLNKMTRNKMYNELFRLQTFFNAKTSTVRGSREVMRQQDISIFGTDERGRPKRRMNLQERTRFWSVYNEFLNTYKTSWAVFGYHKIRQYLGEIIKQRNGPVSLSETMDELLRELSEAEEEPDYGEGDVFSGGWPS